MEESQATHTVLDGHFNVIKRQAGLTVLEHTTARKKEISGEKDPLSLTLLVQLCEKIYIDENSLKMLSLFRQIHSGIC